MTSTTRAPQSQPVNGRTAQSTNRSRAERAATGKQARETAPLRSHAVLNLASDRDPVGLLLDQAESRVPELVPVGHGRMLVSPFTYYRGAALPMAADLARTPTSGLRVQTCGDAHLANFGAFASPERRLVFDLNDFDETLPGPFEWDVKRLVASLEIAGRDRGFKPKQRRRIVLTAARAYREAIRSFAGMPTLDVWYSRLDVEDVLRQFKDDLKRKRYRATEQLMAKARKRDSTQALGKLTAVMDGRRRIISDPPLIVPIEEVFAEVEAEAVYQQLTSVVGSYARTLQPNRQHLLRQFHLVHAARKVVGVGSVGTRAWILLLEADDGDQWLFLQAKEAQPSVLADYAGRSRFTNQGKRVVVGQHLIQAVSDIFLGWERTPGADGIVRDYYVRQLRDWKLSAPIDKLLPDGIETYASLCAWTLARAHARTGDRVAIAAYLGNSTKFDNGIAEFADAYADVNERDYDALAAAVADGRATAQSDV
jgi:uncharacterized protein (DUF2252 family)